MSDKSFKIYKSLYPLSWIYGGITMFRNKLFDWNKIRSKSFDIPTICIGNLSVGGTGKTPHTEYLIHLLHKQYQVAVLSRGYKRATKGYVLSTKDSNADTIGDEPFQIKSKFHDIQVAVDEDRCHGIEELMQLNAPPVDVVLLDDAFQHRYVKAGLNILLTDYNRLFSDDAILPAGRLRESSKGRKRAQIVIVTKCPQDLKPIDYNITAKRLNLFPYQQLYFSSFEYGDLKAIFPETLDNQQLINKKIASIKDMSVLLVTGIASPKPLIERIKKYTQHIDVLSFGDHHNFSIQDMDLIKRRFDELDINNRIIITTEKDATRIIEHQGLSNELKQFMYVQPIEVTILQGQENNFNQQIIEYVRKNSRNSSISKNKNAQ